MPDTSATNEAQSAEILQLAEQGGSAAVLKHIAGLEEPERRKLASVTQRALFPRDRKEKDLDLYVEVMRGIIDRETNALGAAGQSEESDQILNFYNAMSYNLAADLADCWPEDETPREQRHFEAGLRAAEDCIRWRNELNRPPRSFSIAYWAKGIHLLSLGHYNGAVKSFKHSHAFSIRDAIENGKPFETGPAASFDILLGEGYLGLAEVLDGDPSGRPRYGTAIAAFQQQIAHGTVAGDSELKEDAQFGIAQLETVRRKYWPAQ